MCDGCDDSSDSMFVIIADGLPNTGNDGEYNDDDDDDGEALEDEKAR